MMIVLRVIATVLLLAAGIIIAWRPLTPVEQRADVQAVSSIAYHRIGYVLTTLFLIVLVWSL
jgi:hypothetical protein